MRPHPHKDLIIAWANGEIVEYYNPINDTWYEVSSSPDWRPELRFRVRQNLVKLLVREAAAVPGVRISLNTTANDDNINIAINTDRVSLEALLQKMFNK